MASHTYTHNTNGRRKKRVEEKDGWNTVQTVGGRVARALVYDIPTSWTSGCSGGDGAVGGWGTASESCTDLETQILETQIDSDIPHHRTLGWGFSFINVSHCS